MGGKKTRLKQNGRCLSVELAEVGQIQKREKVGPIREFHTSLEELSIMMVR